MSNKGQSIDYRKSEKTTFIIMFNVFLAEQSMIIIMDLL